MGCIRAVVGNQQPTHCIAAKKQVPQQQNPD
jgi:hypothetical protein